MKILLIGGSQNGREIEVPPVPLHKIVGAERGGNFETYLVEESIDGTLYAVAEELSK